MSCCPEILPHESEIDQLNKELFQARYDASFYKSHYQNGIVIRERMNTSMMQKFENSNKNTKKKSMPQKKRSKSWMPKLNYVKGNFLVKRVRKALAKMSLAKKTNQKGIVVNKRGKSLQIKGNILIFLQYLILSQKRHVQTIPRLKNPPNTPSIKLLHASLQRIR